MVDRSARDRLAEAVEAFLADQIGADAFDERIHEIAGETDDDTVGEIVDLLWYHYDDCTDHRAALCRVEWDYLQRLLLLLRSDASLIIDQGRRWGARQAVALAAVVAFIVGVFLLGFGWQLLRITIPLGVVSMLLACWPTRNGKAESDDFVRLTPYASVSELLAVRRSVPAFRKQRYPDALKWRRVRHHLTSGFLWLVLGAVWSPVALLFQALPQEKSTSRVVPA